jgi:hypothetical protein
MVGIVTPAVAEVDAADKGYVPFRTSSMANDHDFLVMGPTQAHPLVEEDVAPGCIHLLAKVAILLGAEPKPVQVRPPEESLDADTAPRCRGEDGSDLRVLGAVETLVRVAAPVREKQVVPGA